MAKKGRRYNGTKKGRRYNGTKKGRLYNTMTIQWHKEG